MPPVGVTTTRDPGSGVVRISGPGGSFTLRNPSPALVTALENRAGDVAAMRGGGAP